MAMAQCCDAASALAASDLAALVLVDTGAAALIAAGMRLRAMKESTKERRLRRGGIMQIILTLREVHFEKGYVSELAFASDPRRAALTVCAKWTGIVEGMDFLQITIEHTDAIEDVIDSIGCFHVEDGG